MDRKVKYEEMVPQELLEAMKEKSICYLPIGSMEWHGPHMGFGMDTVNAYEVSLRIAEKIGGVVLPPLYIGTETERNQETLKKLGFQGTETIVGMDFPHNSVKSMYWPPELFELIVNQYVKLIIEIGFKQVVLMNGHGAERQIEILEKIAGEFTENSDSQVITIMTLFEDCGYGIGHAGLVETSIMSFLRPASVQLEQLPERKRKLKNTEFAIVDNQTFQTGANEDYTVRYDPRDSTAVIGEKLVNHAVNSCIRLIENRFQDRGL